ncbi:hypothetical protein BH10PSE11_BH10PSE11_08020 [soil metagenome]
MRIALTIEQFDTRLGGEQVWVDGLARFLASRNHDVHIVTFLDQSHDFPGEVHVLLDPGGIRSRAISIDTYLTRLTADVVHDSGAALKADIYQPACGSAAYSESRFIAASEISLRLRAAISPRAMMRRMQLHRIERERVMGSRRIIAASQLVADLLMKQHGIPSSAISIVPNGVDTSRFDASRYPDNRDADRAKLGIGKDQIVFLAVANNLLLKGADVSIRALALLHKEGFTNSRLMIAGGQPDSMMKRIIRATHMQDNVTFLGYVPDVAALMRASDAFLHPTRWDTCSLVTTEAMASDLPVITSAMNGASELISNEHDGFVCGNPEDVDAIAASMISLMDPAFRHATGERARRRAKQFDIQANYAEIERHLLELAKGPRC